MPTTRRDFLKTTVIASAGASLSAFGAAAETHGPEQPSRASSAATNGSPSTFTRGIGVYPGSPEEDFGPNLVPADSTYRNLALLRPAYHSSSYDYNLTAQLITDGIKDTRMPTWIATSISGHGPLPINEREVFVDHFPANLLELHGSNPTVEMQLGGGEAPPAIDRIAIFVALSKRFSAERLSLRISASDDGRLWQQVGSVTALQTVSPEPYPPDLAREMHLYYPSVALSQTCRKRFYQVECLATQTAEDSSGVQWQMGQIAFYEKDTRVEIGGPYSFTSAWMSAGSGEEWVYVDLGTRCEFDRVTLTWIARAAEGSLQASDNAESWRTLQTLPAAGGAVDDLRLSAPAQGRYVRVLMTRPSSPDGYILNELEVYGRGGLSVRPKPRASLAPASVSLDGRISLAGGDWRLQRASLVNPEGVALSQPGLDDANWLVATVPGTVLASYVNAGAVQEPNFGQHQLHISDSYFYSDFWYRTEFDSPMTSTGEMVWLNFDGLNWKADIFLNGEKLGRIEGAFTRGHFDLSPRLLHGKANVLAVRVEKNNTPGSAKQKTYESPGKNGGALGLDNPTFHASIGWDWIPTIRGRNTGIWGDVYLSKTGVVTLGDPLVTSVVCSSSQADVSIVVDLVNHQGKRVDGTLRGHFGDIALEQRVSLDAFARKSVVLDSTTQAGLRLEKAQLWWPAGYGEAFLYDVELRLEGRDHHLLDKKAFKAGVRQMTASEDGGTLKLFINGRRFIASGGNWGFSESMLRYRAREYDIAVRYHREMNFTMIRNWVGQIPDDAFFDACDRHGVVVWQDFWLANPFDGPVPADNTLFLKNAEDFVRRIRRHASIGIYCGRNEGYPPAPLEQGLRKLLGELHPDICYIGSSADDVVSGHGPYMTLPASTYFQNADAKLHSEIGAPTIPPIESVRAMMPESAIWPQGLDWGLHDFCLQGAQGGTTFLTIINESYGGAANAEEWIALAQLVNYETYRAIFEAQSKYRMGLLLWMSHPCWPSFVWQTYDYYFEPTAVYFACKKACEPLHIQWNRTTDHIDVVNYRAGSVQGLTAQAEIYNLDGSSKWSKTASLDSVEDSTVSPISLESVAELSPVHFLRLTLASGGQVISTNFYLRALQEGDYRAIRQLPTTSLRADTLQARLGNRWQLTTRLENRSTIPALMARVKVVREKSGDRILPAIYSDNYISMMPGEQRSITIEFSDADTRGEQPAVVLSGFNVARIQ